MEGNNGTCQSLATSSPVLSSSITAPVANLSQFRCHASSRDHSANGGVASSGGSSLERSRRARLKQTHRLLDNKYQLGEELGRGSSGKVYRALNLETGDFRAIKEIPTQNMPSGHLDSVQSEIDLLHNLQHARIVRYFQTIRTANHLYLVLEYVENGSLASIVKNFGRFPEPLVSVYVKQVLEGLEWLHQHGVCHHDIKGANLLITKDGHIKLADFGVARSRTDGTNGGVTNANTVVGTPYWMAPEIIQMSGFSTASDIWSLGCTVIELLTGEPPYYDLAPISALYRIVQDSHPPIPTEMSPELHSFLLSCFERDTDKRPTASQLREHPWLASSAPSTEAEPLLPSSERRQRTQQRIAQMSVGTVTTIRPPHTSGYDSEADGSGGYSLGRSCANLSFLQPYRSHGAEQPNKLYHSMPHRNHSMPHRNPCNCTPQRSHHHIHHGHSAGQGDSSRRVPGGSGGGRSGHMRSRSHEQLHSPHGKSSSRGNECNGDSTASTGSAWRADPAQQGGGNSAAAMQAAAAKQQRKQERRRTQQEQHRAHSLDRHGAEMPPLSARGDAVQTAELSCSPRATSITASNFDSSAAHGAAFETACTLITRAPHESARQLRGAQHLSEAHPAPAPAVVKEIASRGEWGVEEIASRGEWDVGEIASRGEWGVGEIASRVSAPLNAEFYHQPSTPSSAENSQPLSPHLLPAASLPHDDFSQQQRETQKAAEQLLSGLLWKRGSSWRSFAYQRRFFCLTEDAICYRARPTSLSQGLAAAENGEKRIPLSSVLNVRMYSKLKFEFELVCSSRTYRLRAPSAQALALWVTTISSEWMQLQHQSTQSAVLQKCELDLYQQMHQHHAGYEHPQQQQMQQQQHVAHKHPHELDQQYAGHEQLHQMQQQLALEQHPHPHQMEQQYAGHEHQHQMEQQHAAHEQHLHQHQMQQQHVGHEHPHQLDQQYAGHEQLHAMD